jgi:hypothetical protein
MAKEPCVHEYLARTAFGEVITCRKCGTVHLRLQNLSLQFSAEAFIGLVGTLNTASGNITSYSAPKAVRLPLKSVN